MEDILALIGRAHQGDKEARDTLVEKNIGLVHSIVRRFLNRGVEAEDLFQIGSIGLLKAIDKFDTLKFFFSISLRDRRIFFDCLDFKTIEFNCFDAVKSSAHDRKDCSQG